MRPLRLEIEGFGAFRDRQRLDFAALGPDALFLVHGPTGAGKTTVLDAICFALFGESSGGEREGRQLRSQHAPPGAPTEVLLDFALADRTYRVRRSPEYDRPKARGEGVTRQPAVATLWRLDGPGADAAAAEVLAERHEPATERLTALLGFSAEQFRQVALLPQGRFRDLLVANSTDREAILAVLFGTERLKRLETFLRQHAKGTWEACKLLTARRDDILGRAGAADAAGLAGAFAAATGEVAAAAAGVPALETAAAAGRLALDRARADAGKLAELAAARGALARLEAGAPEAEAADRRLKAARRAAAVEPVRAVRDKAAAAELYAQRDFADAEAKQQTAEALLAAAEAALAAEAARSDEREAAAREALRLEGLAPRLREAFDRRTERDAAVAEAAAARAERGRLEGEVAALGAELAAGREDLVEARVAAAEAGALEAALHSAEAAAQARADLARAQGWAEVARSRSDAKATEAEAGARRATNAKSGLRRLEEGWRAGQAGRLAGLLAEGEPCPVCGSADHPRPARPARDLPRDDELELARRRAEDDEAFAADLAREATEARIGFERAEADAVAKAEALGADAAAEPEDLAARAAGLRVRAEGAGAAAKRAVELEAALSEAEARRGATAAEAGAARDAAEAAEAGRAAAVERASAAAHDLPQAWTAAPGPDAAARQAAADLRAAAGARDRLEAALAEAGRGAGEAGRARVAALAAVEAAARQADEAGARLREAARAVAAGLAGAGFADEAAYGAARLKPEEANGLERALAEWREARRSAADRATLAEGATAGLDAPDLPAAEAAEREAAAALHGARDRLVRLDEARKLLEKLAAEHAAAEAALADAERRHAVCGRLAEVAGGTSGPKVSFQRFVLAALLDEVLEAASRRLAAMTRGRFELRRAVRDPAGRGGRSANDLDLEVDDAFTGRSRPVATLSGGEGFMASLALALGLADTVQARSGGVRLDAVFVDEGFGSLDPEALDQALQVLTELRRGGRLVGIVSHVEELKERIDVRLEVTRAERGSHARFVLP